MDRKNVRTASRRVVLCALLAAVMTALKEVMSFLPNIEPVSLLIMVYARGLRNNVFYIIYTFVLLEGLLYGFHLWWVTYLYIWALWALAVLLLSRRKEPSPLVWAVACGAFGLGFGALDALPYLAGGPMAAVSRWLTGIPFDVLHGVGNFFLALALEQPLYRALARARDRTGW